jgi:hypothetical protein
MADTFGGTPFDGHILYVNPDFLLPEVAWAFLSRFRLPDAPASFRTGTLTGKSRLKRRGEKTVAQVATWRVGFGNETWWATDADERPFAGSSTGKSRRKLAFTTDAATTLAAAIAERLGVDAASVTVDGDPTVRATVGKRARIAGVVRFGGATPGTLVVKLAGPLTP